MANHIKRGESIYIPFRDGFSISDSQLKPRMYKSPTAFVKHFPGHYLGNVGVELVEYAEVVRCKDCKWFNHPGCAIYIVDDSDKPKEDDFCSCGERKDNE